METNGSKRSVQAPPKTGWSCPVYKSYLCRGDKTKSVGTTDTKIDPTETKDKISSTIDDHRNLATPF